MPINWDLGVADGAGSLLAPTNSVAPARPRVPTASPSNIVGFRSDSIVSPYDVGVTFNTWRNNPAFLGAIMISADLPPNLMGNYHLIGTGTACTGSPACNLGAANKAVPAYQQPPTPLAAPAFDIDNQPRPSLGGFDSGADEYRRGRRRSISKTTA